MRTAPKRRRRGGDAPRPPHRGIRSYALLIAAAIAIVAIGWLVITTINLFAPAGAIVTVPTFIGSQYANAQSAARTAGVGVRVVATKADFHAPKGQVVGQLPAAGEKVRQGRIIDLVLSEGQPTAKVPNVANMTVRDATVTIENAQLEVGDVGQRYDGDVAQGTVLDQKPEALTQVPAGSKVDLTIANGRPIEYAPNFVGMTVPAAVTAAKGAGIALSAPVQLALAPSAPPKGIIASQDPPAGQQLRPHQSIQLQISGGPIPSAPPSPLAMPSSSPEASVEPGQSPSAATAAPSLLPSPGAQRGLRVSVALPQSSAPTRVRVVLLDATGARTLYDQQTRGGFTLSFDITVTGAGTLQTFVGDSLVNSTPL